MFDLKQIILIVYYFFFLFTGDKYTEKCDVYRFEHLY